MIVANTSPIILLGKQGMLALLKQCFGRVSIPASVSEEILKKKASPETLALKQAVREGWLVVEETVVLPFLSNTTGLGKGEQEAISLAYQHHCLLIIDDDTAKTFAGVAGVDAHGLLYVLLRAVQKKYLKPVQARALLDGMLRDGFYLSTEVYAHFCALVASSSKGL